MLIIYCISLPFPASVVSWLILAIRKDFSAGRGFLSGSGAFDLTDFHPDSTRWAEMHRFPLVGKEVIVLLLVFS